MINIIIDKFQEGIRLDKFLFSKYKNISITDIQKFIKKKEIKVNNNKINSNYILVKNDIITFSDFIKKILESPFKAKIEIEKKIDIKYNNLITNNIIFQDNNLLVINKPSGLSVQGGTGIKISIDRILKNLVSEKENNLKLVHRLDKDTSGVLLIAKNIETANALTKIFKSKNNIKKEYLAFIYGYPKNKCGTINFPLIKKYDNNIEKVYVDKVNGKEAVTKYEIIKYYKKYDISLVKIEILTGRTHQIRVHFKEIGYPIVGDYKYGKKNNIFNNTCFLGKNLLLHSYRTSLKFFGKDYVFIAKIPEYMKMICGDVSIN